MAIYRRKIPPKSEMSDLEVCRLVNRALSPHTGIYCQDILHELSVHFPSASTPIKISPNSVCREDPPFLFSRNHVEQL